MYDPIVEKVRKIRDAHAKKFNYNVDQIVSDLVEKQKTSQKRVVNLNKLTAEIRKK